MYLSLFCFFIIFSLQTKSASADVLAYMHPNGKGVPASWFDANAWTGGVLPGVNDTVLISGLEANYTGVTLDCSETVRIEQLIVLNAHFTIDCTVSGVGLEIVGRESYSSIDYESDVLVRSGSSLIMPVVCSQSSVTTTLGDCLDNATPTLVVRGKSLLIFEANTAATRDMVRMYGGLTVVQGRNAEFVVDDRAISGYSFSMFDNVHVTVTASGIFRFINSYASGDTDMAYLHWHRSTLHVDYRSQMIMEYDQATRARSCSELQNFALFITGQDVWGQNFSPIYNTTACQLCIDGLLHVRTPPCAITTFSGVLHAAVSRNGAMNILDLVTRVRGTVLVDGGHLGLGSEDSAAYRFEVRGGQFFMAPETRVTLHSHGLLKFTRGAHVAGCESMDVVGGYAISSSTTSSSYVDADTWRFGLADFVDNVCVGGSTPLGEVDAPGFYLVSKETSSLHSYIYLDEIDSSSGYFIMDSAEYHTIASVADVGMIVGPNVVCEAPMWLRWTRKMFGTFDGQNIVHGLLHLVHEESVFTFAGKTGNVALLYVDLIVSNGTFVLGNYLNENFPSNFPVALVSSTITVEGTSARMLVGYVMTNPGRVDMDDSTVTVRDGATLANCEEDGSSPNRPVGAYYSTLHFSAGITAVQSMVVLDNASVRWNGTNDVATNDILFGGSVRPILIVRDSTIDFLGGGSIDMAGESNPQWAEQTSFDNVLVRCDTDTCAVILPRYNELLFRNFRMETADFSFDHGFTNFYVPTDANILFEESVVFTGGMFQTQSSTSIVRLAPSSHIEFDCYAVIASSIFVDYQHDGGNNASFVAGTEPTIDIKYRGAETGLLLSSTTMVGPIQVNVYGRMTLDNVQTGYNWFRVRVFVADNAQIFLSSFSTWIGADPESFLHVNGGAIDGIAPSGSVTAQVEWSWMLTNGGRLSNVKTTYKSAGLCLDGVVENVRLHGIADLQCRSAQAISFHDILCQLPPVWPTHAPFQAMKSEYEQWSAQGCPSITGFDCCVRVSHAPGGVAFSLSSGFYGGVVFGAAVASKLVTSTQFVRYMALLAPPSDAKMWHIRRDRLDVRMSIGLGVDAVYDTTYNEDGLHQFKNVFGLGVDDGERTPTLHMLGPMAPSFNAMRAVRLIVHGKQEEAVRLQVPQMYDPLSEVIYSPDSEAILVWSAHRGNTTHLVQLGAVVGIHDVGLAQLSNQDGYSTQNTLMLDGELFVNGWARVSSFDVVVNVGAHLHVNRTHMFIVNGAVEVYGTLTMGSEARLSLTSNMVVYAGGRLVLGKDVQVLGDVVMLPGSMLVLRPGANATFYGLTIDGARVEIVTNDESTSAIEDLEAMLVSIQGGKPVLSDGMTINRYDFRSDASVPLPTLKVLNALNNSMVASPGDEAVIGDEAVTCAPVPSAIALDACMACVSDSSRLCVYAVVALFTNVYGAVCLPGDSLLGVYHPTAPVNRTAGTEADCAAFAQPRCHRRLDESECVAHNSGAPFFEKDASVPDSALCAWCNRTGGPGLCMTVADVNADLCDSDFIVVDRGLSTATAASVTVKQMTSAPVSETSGGAPVIDGDGLSPLLVGGLSVLGAALCCVAIVSVFLFVIVPRRKQKADEEGDQALSESSSMELSSLAPDSRTSHLPSTDDPVYAGASVLGLGQSSGEYMDGEMDPMAGGLASIKGVYSNNIGSSGSGGSTLIDGGYGHGELGEPPSWTTADTNLEYARGDLLR